VCAPWFHLQHSHISQTQLRFLDSVTAKRICVWVDTTWREECQTLPPDSKLEWNPLCNIISPSNRT
jgi:hypothetical protein